MMSRGSIKSGIGVFVALAILFMYANTDHELTLMGYTFKKNRDLKINAVKILTKSEELQPDILTKDSVLESKLSNYDSSKKKILLVGDSQAEGIMYPFGAYAANSGHELVLAFPWYSASDKTYASNDTLKQVIQRYKPDYIVFVIGLNQILQTNLDPSIEAVSKILETIGDIPFSWIGPANWVEDKGINKVYQENLPQGTFFLSKNLQLPRGADGRHPNNAGYKTWTDSIATWLNNSAKWKIRMLKPESFNRTRSFPVKTLNAGRRNRNSEANKEEDSSNQMKADSISENQDEHP